MLTKSDNQLEKEDRYPRQHLHVFLKKIDDKKTISKTYAYNFSK